MSRVRVVRPLVLLGAGAVPHAVHLLLVAVQLGVVEQPLGAQVLVVDQGLQQLPGVRHQGEVGEPAAGVKQSEAAQHLTPSSKLANFIAAFQLYYL